MLRSTFENDIHLKIFLLVVQYQQHSLEAPPQHKITQFGITGTLADKKTSKSISSTKQLQVWFLYTSSCCYCPTIGVAHEAGLELWAVEITLQVLI